MNVPPLITAAVSATANAPSERLPRKYLRRNPALRLVARLATTPSASDTSVNSTSASRVAGWAWTASALVMPRPFADVRLQLGRVVGPQVVIGHDEPGEPGREQAAGRPRDHVAPEPPRGHPQDRPDVLAAERVPLAEIAEQV